MATFIELNKEKFFFKKMLRTLGFRVGKLRTAQCFLTLQFTYKKNNVYYYSQIFCFDGHSLVLEPIV